MIDIDRLGKALKDIFTHNEADRWIYGLVGKAPASAPTFEVTGRANFIHVRVRNASGSQTTTPARNDAGVPHSYDLPVRMRYDGKTLVIDGVVYRDDLATTDPPPPTGGWIHIHDDRYFRENEHINVSAGAGDAGKPIVLDAGGKLDASLLDSEDIADVTGAMVTGNTETGITVTYDDADNTLDFVVDTEFIADTVGAMVSGNTETDIAVTYDDADNTLDFVLSPTLVADRIVAATDKATPVDADSFGIVDSAASNVLKKLTWANLKATLQTFLDTIYVIAGGKAGGQSIHGDTAANGDLTVRGTIHPTKTSSYILMQPDGGNVGIGPIAAPTNRLWVEEDVANTNPATFGYTATDAAITRGNVFLNRDQSADSVGGVRFDMTDNSGSTTRGASIAVGKEQLFTSTNSTKDGYMDFMVALNGVLTRVGRFTSAGVLSITQIIRAMSASGLRLEDDGGNAGVIVADGGGLTLNILTANWDIGEDRRLLTEALRARDGEGLQIEDDAGNVGIIVEDGGLVGHAGTKAVTAQFDKTNTTLADVTGLPVTVTAAKRYKFRAILHITANATGGLKVAIGGTCTATNIIYHTIFLNSLISFDAGGRHVALGGTTAISNDTVYLVTIEGSILVNAAGTLTPQFAQNAASGTSSVLVGSNFTVELVP